MFIEEYNLLKTMIKIKKKRGSNGMEPNLLIPNIIYKSSQYLNVSINFYNSARMAEWLTQLVDTESPSKEGVWVQFPLLARLYSN